MIQFESTEVQLRKFREKLRQMSDQELVDFGRALGRVTRRVSGRLAEARAEWMRRHPRAN